MVRSVTVHSAEFKLSITRALADQLAEALLGLHPESLTETRLGALQERPGVYELFLQDERVYVGKASVSLPSRLRNHFRKLSGRAGITLSDVRFQCLYVDEDLEAAAPEKMLIKKYKTADLDGTLWNANGFGNKDPGRRRDDSLVKANHFDALYPANLDLQISAFTPGTQPANKYLSDLKKTLPFNLRFQTKPASSLRVYRESIVIVPPGVLAARDLISLAVSALPEGWQATALPGYVILYEEDRTYESARTVWRRRRGILTVEAGAARLDEPGDVEDEPTDDE